MLSKKYKSTRELLGALMEGGEAVKRDNPRGNETSYFFMVPKAQSPTGEEVINVPDGVDPQAFKAAGYKVPETASASTSGFGSTGSSSTSSWGSSSSPASSWNGMSNPTAEWGNTNSSSSGWGSSTSGFGSPQNSGFGTQNPWGSNTGYGSTENTTPSFWGSTNSGLSSSSNSWDDKFNTAINLGKNLLHGYLSKPLSEEEKQIFSLQNRKPDCTFNNVVQEYRRISPEMDVQNPISLGKVMPFIPKNFPLPSIVKQAVAPLKNFDVGFDIGENTAKILTAYENICKKN